MMIPQVQERAVQGVGESSQRDISPYRVAPERTRSEVIETFVSEMVAPLIEPLASSLTSNPLEDEEGEGDHQDTFIEEMASASWGRTLIQGPAFQGLREVLSQQLDLRERVLEAQKLLRWGSQPK